MSDNALVEFLFTVVRRQAELCEQYPALVKEIDEGGTLEHQFYAGNPFLP